MLPLPIYLLAVNGATFLFYALDKRAARRGGWRISEFMLLMFGFAGGTMAAFLAQRFLRHKNRKRAFQVKFWAVTAVQAILILFPPPIVQQIMGRLFYM